MVCRLWIDWTAIGIHQDVFGHLNGATVWRDFRAPPTDDVRGGVERRDDTTDDAFPGANDRTRSIANDRARPSANRPAGHRARLVGAGRIARRGATGAKHSNRNRNSTNQNRVNGFHLHFN